MTTTISSISSYTGTQSNEPVNSTEDLGDEAFLRLLVTQMQYQDPLNPQENEEFVAQLAQFSQLEQLTNARFVVGNVVPRNRIDEQCFDDPVARTRCHRLR